MKKAYNVTKNDLLVFKYFAKILSYFFDILNFKNSSDRWKHLTCCFRRNQPIDLQIKMHFLLIYAKSLKNNFERIQFSVKFCVMGSGGEIMAGNGWWRQNYGYSWMVLGGGGEIMSGRRWLQVVTAKLWLVVGGGDKINDWSWVVVDGCTI